MAQVFFPVLISKEITVYFLWVNGDESVRVKTQTIT